MTWHSDSEHRSPIVRQSDKPNNSSLKEDRKQGDQAKGTAFSPGKQPPIPNNGSLQEADGSPRSPRQAPKRTIIRLQ